MSWLKRIGRRHPLARAYRRANGDLWLEKCEAVTIRRMSRYSRNVVAVQGRES